MNIFFALATMGLTGSYLAAEARAESEPSETPSFASLSTDSLTWVIDGYSVIASFEVKRTPYLRYHIEAFGIDIPESLIDGYPPNEGERWSRRIDGAIMLSVDYHPFAKAQGLHVGGGFNLQSSTVSRKTNTRSEQFTTFEPILRTGYQWFPLQNRQI